MVNVLIFVLTQWHCTCGRIQNCIISKARQIDLQLTITAHMVFKKLSFFIIYYIIFIMHHDHMQNKIFSSWWIIATFLSILCRNLSNRTAILWSVVCVQSIVRSETRKVRFLFATIIINLMFGVCSYSYSYS